MLHHRWRWWPVCYYMLTYALRSGSLSFSRVVTVFFFENDRHSALPNFFVLMWLTLKGMLLMRGRPSQLKTMAESVDSVGCSLPSSTTASAPLGTDLKKTALSASVVGNNNKTVVNFKSQSPSEDNSIRYGALACETDHMYAHNTGDAVKYRELAEEVTHLKAMILFHLDLIQQQSEANAAKDKQISALRQENEMLKQRLERMERRVQLQSFKQKPDQPATESPPATKAPDSQSHPDNSVTNAKHETQTSIEIPVHVAPDAPELLPSITTDESTAGSDGEPPKKRIKTLLPIKPKPPSPNLTTTRRRRSMKSCDSEPGDVITNQQPKVEAPSPTSNLLDDLINQAVQEGAIISVPDANLPDDKIFEARVVLEPCLIPLQVVDDIKIERVVDDRETKQQTEPANGCVEPPDTHEELLPIEPEHKRIREMLTQKSHHREPVYLKKDAILTTDEPYVTHVGEWLGTSENMCDSATHQAHVEVPRWVIKPLSGRASSQGVENLDDEVFTKRHQKHELDEKRRKRWDLQRIREQRRYEKLRARYEGEDRSQDRGKSKASPHQAGAFENDTSALTSFWSDPEDVTHIQVEPWLPVNVFGAPLPNLPRTDFGLPWKFNRPGDACEPATKRRQRRSYKAE